MLLKRLWIQLTAIKGLDNMLVHCSVWPAGLISLEQAALMIVAYKKYPWEAAGLYICPWKE